MQSTVRCRVSDGLKRRGNFHVACIPSDVDDVSGKENVLSRAFRSCRDEPLSNDWGVLFRSRLAREGYYTIENRAMSDPAHKKPGVDEQLCYVSIQLHR
jgi:hypothetical protein